MNCIGLTKKNCIVSEKEHRSFENDENFHNNVKYFTFGKILYNIEKQKKASGFLLNSTYLTEADCLVSNVFVSVL